MRCGGLAYSEGDARRDLDARRDAGKNIMNKKAAIELLKVAARSNSRAKVFGAIDEALKLIEMTEEEFCEDYAGNSQKAPDWSWGATKLIKDLMSMSNIDNACPTIQPDRYYLEHNQQIIDNETPETIGGYIVRIRNPHFKQEVYKRFVWNATHQVFEHCPATCHGSIVADAGM